MTKVDLNAKEASAILKASFGGKLDDKERETLGFLILKYRKSIGEVF